MSTATIEFIDTLAAITAHEWNAVAGTDYPFTRHEFLYNLEQSGSADRDSGWQAQHVLVKRDSRLIAVMPLYLKDHSYGEYVFDWAGPMRIGVTVARIIRSCSARFRLHPPPGRDCVSPLTKTRARLHCKLCKALNKKIAIYGYFVTAYFVSATELLRHFAASGTQRTRGACNITGSIDNYSSFDDFLATFRSRKRKNLRKERARIAEQELELRVLEGAQLTAEHWQLFSRFYAMTYAKRSGHSGYLNAAFFQALGAQLREHIVMTLAYWHGEAVAGALYFRDSTTLYGRYWGCVREFDCLHFEACYYQGIEYCIRHGLQHFDPGAQGEHKIQRGFTPIKTFSYHWLKDSAFRTAIDDFLSREQQAVEAHIEAAAELLPFKQDNDN